MDDKQSVDFTRIPTSAEVKGTPLNHSLYESLEEGRIPTRLPYRVKTGSADETGITLATSSEIEEFGWDEVEYVALGIISTDVDYGQAPESDARKMFKSLLTGQSHKLDKIPEKIETYLLDFYIKDHDTAFRIDQSFINYTGFLDEVGYISRINFRNLINKIASFLDNQKFNSNMLTFLEGRREDIKKHATINDFELEERRDYFLKKELKGENTSEKKKETLENSLEEGLELEE
ncbi:MAG: hypothetical protein ACLFQV_06965 [Vulcanimicrobiota bacterium]